MKIKASLFIKSFLLAFIALALVAAIIITSTYIERSTVSPEATESTLLIGLVDRNKALSLIVINFDPVNSMISFLPIPDNTLLENSVILQSMYENNDATKIVNSIEGIIGTDIDRYALFSTDALVNVVNDMGEFEFLIPHKFVHDGQLHSGLEKYMNGELAKAMFTYGEYDMKKVSLSDIAVSFVYSFLSKYANSSYSADLQNALISAFVDNTIITNLNKDEIAGYCTLFAKYSAYSHRELKIKGTVHNDSSSSVYFTPETLHSNKNIFK